MKYAIKFYRGCRVLDKADEIIIKYDYIEPDLVRFVTTRPENQRIIVNIINLPPEQEQESLAIFQAAQREHKNIAILCSFSQNIIVDLDLLNLPYFFAEWAKNFDDLAGMLRFHISDIYISGELGFYLDKVSKICKEQNIKVRVCPNMAQTSSEFDFLTENIKKFFIRPDDVEFYEQYIDVFEFMGSLMQQPVYYDIYRDGRWLGDLNEIIINLNQSVHDMAVLPSFRTRATCGKRCAFGSCDLCSRVVDVSKSILDKGLAIKRDKRTYDVNSTEELSADTDFTKEIE